MLPFYILPVVRYFSDRGIKKICFITEKPPSFEVWGDLVNRRKECQVYFVTGEITDVTVLKNANLSAACAVILLFPEKVNFTVHLSFVTFHFFTFLLLHFSLLTFNF